MPVRRHRLPWATLILLSLAALGVAGERWLGRSRYAPPARVEEAVIRIATNQVPNTLDWNLSSDDNGPNYPVARATMRGLVTFGPHQDLVLDVASRLEVDEPRSPRRYTFHLRDDVRWSDGAPLRAQDFVFGWRRALLGSESKEFSDIEGVPEYLTLLAAGNAPAAQVAAALERVGIRALDDRTLEIRLSGPRSFFLGRVAGVYAFYPGPSHLLAGRGEAAIRAYYRQPRGGQPVALGPYRVAAWNRLDQSMELVTNPAYPHLENQIPRIVLFPSQLAPVLYAQGRVDFLLLDDGPSAFQHPEDRQVVPLWGTFWLGFNTGDPRTGGVPLKVRKAVAMALDRPELGKGLLPRFRAATQLLPEGLPGRLPDSDPRLKDLLPHDVDAARRLVAEAGWTGKEITLVYRTSGTFLPEAALAEAIRGQLAAIGLVIQPKGAKSLADELRGRDRHTRHGLFLRRTGADYNHPNTFLSVFHYGEDPAQDNGSFTEFEMGGRREAYVRFARAAEAVSTTSDLAEQTAHAWEAERILLADEVVMVPLFHPDRFLRRRPWFTGLTIDPFNFLDFTRLQFVPPGRKP